MSAREKISRLWFSFWHFCISLLLAGIIIECAAASFLELNVTRAWLFRILFNVFILLCRFGMYRSVLSTCSLEIKILRFYIAIQTIPLSFSYKLRLWKTFNEIRRMRWTFQQFSSFTKDTDISKRNQRERERIQFFLTIYM